MTELPRIGILHRLGGAANLSDIYRSAQGVCQPVLFLPRSYFDDAEPVATLAGQLFETVPYGQSEFIDVARASAVRGLTTFHDADLDLLDVALAELARPGLGAVSDPWDKLVQRQLLPAHCSVPAKAVDSAACFRAAIQAIGLPAVLKPRRATGGSGIAFLTDLDQVVAHQETRTDWGGLLLEAMLPTGQPPAGVDYLADFVSVETVNVGQERWHAAVTDKVPVAVADVDGSGTALVGMTGDVLPTRLAGSELTAVLDAVSLSLDALDVRDRVTHTEVRLTAEGPKIIEINGRVGGHLARLLAMLGGPDLIRIALQLAAGLVPERRLEQLDGCGMTYYPNFRRRQGSVQSRVVPADVRRLPGVSAVAELAKFGHPFEQNSRRMVNLTLRAPDFATLDRDAAETAARIDQLFAADQ